MASKLKRKKKTFNTECWWLLDCKISTKGSKKKHIPWPYRKGQVFG